MTSQDELKIGINDVIKEGNVPLNKKELEALIVGKTVQGIYEHNGNHYYASYISPEGNVNGQNDSDSYDEGHYDIDEDGVFIVSWQGYWEDWKAYAFHIAGCVKFYEVESGMWKTTFYQFDNGKLPLKITK